MKVSTKESYAKRIERVITYLTEHLDQPLDFHRLAEKANLSSYHFHRVYTAMMGETLAQTVRRLRLHRAAACLLCTTRPFSAVARDAGYSSVQAFARAFKAAYQLSPVIYRKQGGITHSINIDVSGREVNALHHDVSIGHREPVCSVALRHIGDYMEIGHSFERMAAWALGRGLFGENCQVFVIYLDDPTSVDKGKLRADVCISVSNNFSLGKEDKFFMRKTPGGRCALLKHVGPFSELAQTYNWLFGCWLPEQEEVPDDQPHFEVHLNDPRSVPPALLETHICLPLKPK